MQLTISDIEKKLYYAMLRIRLVEERIAELYPEQQMRCPVHLCTGQEAIAAGVSAHLTPDDYALSNHRSHGHYLAKGGDLKAMMAEIYGRVTGCSRGKGGSMHLVDLAAGFLGATPIVGSTIPMAVGAALATVMKGEKRVTVAYFGDAAVEEGVFHESLNFAALKRLPVVFVCENNFFSVYSPLSVRQPADNDIFRLAGGHGVPGCHGDGNSVTEVYNLAGKAIARARNGEGPSFLEFKTYRWREHCGPNYDNHLGYRTEAEYQEWRQRCPVENYAADLLSRGVSHREIEAIKKELQNEIEEAIAFARQSPFPEETALLEDVYAERGLATGTTRFHETNTR